jgi:hypothetical protein
LGFKKKKKNEWFMYLPVFLQKKVI